MKGGAMYKLNMGNHEYYVPERMMPGITRYIEQGIRPGRFLQAVICNDLHEALSQADDENFTNISAFVSYFYNEAPSGCWGSPEKMEAWIESKQKSPLFTDVCAVVNSLDGMYRSRQKRGKDDVKSVQNQRDRQGMASY